MENIIIDLESWVFWAILLIIIIFIIWLITVKFGFTYSDKNQFIQEDEEQFIQEDKPLIIKNKDFVFNSTGRKFGSIGEELTCKVFEEYLSREVEINLRPDILKNPETNRNLEYDMYDEETRIAIEYNGEQHYTFPCKFHKDEKSFIDQIYRDDLKHNKSIEHHITLITVPFTIDTCVIDQSSSNGYKKCPKLTREERETKIRKYLVPILDNHFNKVF